MNEKLDNTLFDISILPIVDNAELESAYKKIDESLKLNSNIERSEVWLYDSQLTINEWQTPSDANNTSPDTFIISEEGKLSYFAVLKSSYEEPVSNAANHNSLQDLRLHYLIPLDVNSFVILKSHHNEVITAAINREHLGRKKEDVKFVKVSALLLKSS